MQRLKGEFRNLSFLWGEGPADATEAGMTEWKRNILYGPPLSADVTQDVDQSNNAGASFQSRGVAMGGGMMMGGGIQHRHVAGPSQGYSQGYSQPIYR